MSFSYNRMTEEEAQKAREFPLLPDGIYDFVVTENKFTHSRNGNPMIALKVKITHEGVDFNVFSNLIGVKNMEWFTRHFCESTGLVKEYEEGKFNERLCANRRGICSVTTKEARPDPEKPGQFYKAKNEISDFLTADKLGASARGAFPAKTNTFASPSAGLPPLPAGAETEPFDDEIPF